MEGELTRNFKRGYLLLCGGVFILVCLRAFLIPFTHDEASTFFFYVQSDNYLPYKAHVYTNNHVLNSALSNIFYHLGGSHRFVLRLPNVLSFLVLCYGVYRFFRHLRYTGARILLAGFFILTFNFLDFFELCRGYGLSMAFALLGLACLMDYFRDREFRQLLLFSLYWQLALAANLTLVILLSMLVVFVLLFQLRMKLFKGIKNWLLLLVNLGILFFWIKFSFFYKEQGVLDSGIGEDYWEVSFKSLMLFIFGTDYLWMQLLVLGVFILIVLVSLFWFFKKPVSFNAVFQPRFFYILFLCSLVLVFFLLKQLMQINYPEDRTGLFFYLFFALSLVFFFDAAGKTLSWLAAAPMLVGSLIYFALSFNLNSFGHYFYHVLPREFYSYLEQEYHKNGDKTFTIGGHTNREMNYAFLNYRGGGLLNPMDEGTPMCMNCDYYIALEEEKPYYERFYDEVLYDKYWGRVLLKRKQPLERREIPALTQSYRGFAGSDEFYEFLRVGDSLLPGRNCLEADMSITFKKAPAPFKAFLVFQVNDEQNNGVYYKRALLNWLADDLSGSTRRIKLTTGPLPAKISSVIVYLWNIDKKEMDMVLNDLKIYELHGPGVNLALPPDFYQYMEKMKQKHLL